MKRITRFSATVEQIRSGLGAAIRRGEIEVIEEIKAEAGEDVATPGIVWVTKP